MQNDKSGKPQVSGGIKDSECGEISWLRSGELINLQRSGRSGLTSL